MLMDLPAFTGEEPVKEEDEPEVEPVIKKKPGRKAKALKEDPAVVSTADEALEEPVM